MSAPAKVGAFLTGLAVALWSFLHGPFNGASLLVELGLAALIVVLWRRQARHDCDCPHCRGELETFWTSPCKRRSDGV